uniref:Bassoon presynaptic cytomatrix protein n=1 Tax=Scleropages formosus TaxID=113540 RepID=A0A8C9TBW2_SCLFO
MFDSVGKISFWPCSLDEKTGARPGPGDGRTGPPGRGQELPAGSPGHSQNQAQGPSSRQELQVDVKAGKSPSATPVHGSAPTSPYSLPQIAPMPSSTLCPVCKTTDLSASQDRSSCNTCTQCRSTVCNQCGFNPNPHLTEVQEWLCLNCQMQRALGMDMTTPRAKGQQETELSPGTEMHVRPTLQPSKSDTQTQERQERGGRSSQPLVKAPSQPDLSRSSTTHQPEQARSAGSSPSRQSQEQPFGKLFGFGASLLNQASTLISAEALAPSQPQPSSAKGPHVPASGSAPGLHAPPKKQPAPMPKGPEKTKANCPLCKTELNIQSTSEPPNYNSCTQCHAQVCNMCGFNPMPHLVEKKEWLCLNCQTQRLMCGALEEPLPVLPPSAVLQKTGSPQHQTPASQEQPLQKKGQGQHADSRLTGQQLQQKPPEFQETKSSTQSLSDTGYSSDGISSSHSEITGLVQEEEMKLTKGEVHEHSLPTHSEVPKLESSKESLLQSKSDPRQELSREHRPSDGDDKKTRPRSLSISQDGCGLDEELGDIREEDNSLPDWERRHNHRKPPKDLTDEDIMRRHILEMSADEEENNEDKEYSYQKLKKSPKHGGDLGKEKRRLSHHSNSYEEERKGATRAFKGTAEDEDDDLLTSQGGLRRFKTIELNTANSYNRDMELSNDNDLSLDREPELEMESLTGSPDERSRGEYSSTLPATTPSYTSGTSPTSVSSMEEDSDSSPSRRQKLEEAKQQRKARHRSHGPLLPTIEDSSEEDELREEEELLREQEKMREVEQQKIRSTARKPKRDKDELRAQRRRERSKTPPSNLSPIEDASPTEELRQAAEMEELHRSSCSEYSPSIDSEAEGFEIMASQPYKTGNLPKFMSLYSPTEKPTVASPSAEKPLKTAEQVYEEMVRKAETLQKQQTQQKNLRSGHQQQFSTYDMQQITTNRFETVGKQLLEAGSSSTKLLEQNNPPLTPGTSPTQVSAPVSFSSGGETGARGAHSMNPAVASQGNQMLTTNQTSPHFHQRGSPAASSSISGKTAEVTQGYNQRDGTARKCIPANTQKTSSEPVSSSLTSKVFSYFKGTSPTASPSTSPTQSPSRSTSRASTADSSTRGTETGSKPVHRADHGATTPAQTPNRNAPPRLSRQQSSQESPFMVVTLGSEPVSPSKPVTVNSSTSPLSSPTRLRRQPTFETSTPTSPHPHLHQSPPQHSSYKTQTGERVITGTSTAGTCSRGSLPVENISLCRISTVPGTSRVVEQGKMQSSNVVDLRTPLKPTPVIMTEQGMDLTSVATETRKYSIGNEASSSRHITAVQPLIMNLNAQEHPHVSVSTPTTVSITVASSMFISQPKQPVVYGDPLQNRVDLGQGMGSAVCLIQSKAPPIDPSIPKIDACLEDLGIQQQQLQLQQQKLQQQQQQLEQQLQATSFARYNLANQVQPMQKKDMLVSQTSNPQTTVSISVIPRASAVPLPILDSSPAPRDIFCGVPLELKNKPTAMNLSTSKSHVMMVELEGGASQGAAVTQLVKAAEPPPQEVLDLTGQIKPEAQVACCDVVYKLPFTGTCKGPFAQKPKGTDNSSTTEPSQSRQFASDSQYSGTHVHESDQEDFQYQRHVESKISVREDHKPQSLPASGRLQPSMSDTNLSVVGIHHCITKSNPPDLAVDLSTMKEAYEGSYFGGVGVQYGSYTDLRQQSDIIGQTFPIRRYGSMSNINTDYRCSSRDPSSFQESNLAQYSATTAREISRMCADLNSMDQFGGRSGSNPEHLQYSTTDVYGLRGRLSLQQGLPSMRPNIMYSSDGRQTPHGQACANLFNARQASLRALYPSAVRAADGMIYSTINTPIASTLPITTQPASVLRPMQRGVYRPYPAGNMTTVPLASLTRLPLIAPRMPLSAQRPYRYPPPCRFPMASIPASASAAGTALETPVYLGKPSVTPTVPGTMHTVSPPYSHLPAHSAAIGSVCTTAVATSSSAGIPTSQQLQLQPHPEMGNVQKQHTQPQIQMQPQTIPQIPSQLLPQVEPIRQAHIQTQLQTHSEPQIQPHIQQQTELQAQAKIQPQAVPQGAVQAQVLPQTQTQPLQQTQPQTQCETVSQAAKPLTVSTSTSNPETAKEEERLRQQHEQLLQLERERVELEKLRQLRLQEELERDRLELQRHREKEQMLVQREIQELQTIKQQVLQQQQAERETQLILQREQLAQQRLQLDQIQSLQQQLQQQLEEQKRQKTAAAEAAAASAAAAAATSAQSALQGVAIVGGAPPQSFSIVCDKTGRVIQKDMPPEFQRTLGPNVQFWQPYVDGQVVQGVIPSRSLPSSASERSLKNNDELLESKVIKKRNSMPRLRDGVEGNDSQPTVKRIADSSVQTDDEDGEERLIVSRRRRTRRIVDSSVQTDDEDQDEWEQPIRRRRSRFSKHSESSSESKADMSKVASQSVAIQTTNDSSCQTEPDQLGRVSPAIHISTAESKVEFLHYISAPERTLKGESLACQTEPEAQSQGVVMPQLNVPTTVSPYSSNTQLAGPGAADALSSRIPGMTKFERRKPDPLDISYQNHMHSESLSNLVRQPPKSPQVLYSPVSPLSPHRLLENSFSSSERLNKAHVTPQKHFTAESPQRHQSLPRPVKCVQRSMSDPKPLSPTSEDPSRTRFSLYHHQALQNSQLGTLQQSSPIRKVKRTLPSPPPEETPLPIMTPALPKIYSSPSTPQRVLPRPASDDPKTGLLNELKVVEQESSKLRMQQAELEEEEKEIDAKLRYLELGITQRKETMIKERERRELAYMRSIGDTRDYVSDSDLSNLHMVGTTFDGSGLLVKPSTAPMNQFTTDQMISTSPFLNYQYPQSQPAPVPQSTPVYQQIGFQPPQYPADSQSQPQPGTFQPQLAAPSTQQAQASGAFPTHSLPQPSSYQTDLRVQQSHPGFQHSPGPTSYASQTLPYPYAGQTPYHTGQSISFQPQADMLTAHQKPRQTSLADLEQKIPTNYEVISNPTVMVTTTGQDGTCNAGYSSTTMAGTCGQYKPPEQSLSDCIHSDVSPTSTYTSEGLYSNLEHNIPRNYVMIEDISELTKENMNTSSDMQRTNGNGRYGSESPSMRMASYGRVDEVTEDLYDPHGSVKARSSYHPQGSGSGPPQKQSSKNMAPTVSSKRSKHRKPGTEQKISKFSPIEEARDVESDLASYSIPTSASNSSTVASRARKLQDDITYGLKKNVYDQQKYYGLSSREGLEEDDRVYSSGRSRSTGYGMDKVTSRDSNSCRSKSYERDIVERSQRGHRSRPSARAQNLEEESPLSPVGKPMGAGRGPVGPELHDSHNQYGSSHSLPDVQEHMKDSQRSHIYKPDDPYLVDDMHCAVSDSEAYHLGQEETDWFEKPREVRSDRSKHYGGSSHSSTHRRSHAKQTYHDYDEPPEEDNWSQDDYSHQRPSSTTSRDHRHHGTSSGRHSSSRHSADDPRPSRTSRGHHKDPSMRHDSRGSSSTQKRGTSESRSTQGYHSSDYSRDSSSHSHSSAGQRTQKQLPSSSSRRQDPQGPPSAAPRQQPSSQQQRLTGGATPERQQEGQPLAGAGEGAGSSTTQEQQTKPGQSQTPGLTQTQSPAQSQGPNQLQAGPQPATAVKTDLADDNSALGMKSAGSQPAKAPTSGIGSKAAPKPGGVGSTIAGQPAADGDSVFSKILPGGAAEQAGKLGDAVSALGKKFTSFW